MKTEISPLNRESRRENRDHVFFGLIYNHVQLTSLTELYARTCSYFTAHQNASENLRHMTDMFDDFLVIADRVILLDSHKSQSPDTKVLRKTLEELAMQIKVRTWSNRKRSNGEAQGAILFSFGTMQWRVDLFAWCCDHTHTTFEDCEI